MIVAGGVHVSRNPLSAVVACSAVGGGRPGAADADAHHRLARQQRAVLANDRPHAGRDRRRQRRATGAVRGGREEVRAREGLPPPTWCRRSASEGSRARCRWWTAALSQLEPTITVAVKRVVRPDVRERGAVDPNRGGEVDRAGAARRREQAGELVGGTARGRCPTESIRDSTTVKSVAPSVAVWAWAADAGKHDRQRRDRAGGEVSPLEEQRARRRSVSRMRKRFATVGPTARTVRPRGEPRNPGTMLPICQWPPAPACRNGRRSSTRRDRGARVTARAGNRSWRCRTADRRCRRRARARPDA